MNLTYYLVIGILVLWTVLWFRFDWKAWWNTGGAFGEGFQTKVGQGQPFWKKIPGKLKSVSSNLKGYVWGVNDHSRIYRRDPGATSWKGVPGGLDQISAGEKNVYGVNRHDNIYKRPVDGTGKWKHIGGKLTNISGSGSGWVWGVNTHDNIYARPKEDKAKSIGWGGWHHIPGKLKQISGGQNEVWGVNKYHNIYKRPVEPIVWKRICPSAGTSAALVNAAPKMRMVVVDGNYVYGCATNNHIYKCPVNGAAQWELIPNSSAVFNIAVAGGYIYGIGMSKGLWKRPTTGTQKFTKIASCCVTQIVVSGGYVYGIGTNRWIYRVSTNGGTWQRVNPSSCCVTNIAVDGGNIYGVGTNKALYKRAIGGTWKRIASCCVTQIVVHGNYIYGRGTNSWVYRVSTNGGKWQRVNPSSCCVTWLAIASGSIYGVGTDKRLWKRPLPDTKNNWKRIGGKLKWVSASNPDYVYGVNSADDIYKCKKPCTGQWSRVPGKLKQISVGQQVWGISNVPDNIYSSNYGGAAPVAAGGSSCVSQFRSGKAGEKMHGPWFGGERDVRWVYDECCSGGIALCEDLAGGGYKKMVKFDKNGDTISDTGRYHKNTGAYAGWPSSGAQLQAWWAAGKKAPGLNYQFKKGPNWKASCTPAAVVAPAAAAAAAPAAAAAAAPAAVVPGAPPAAAATPASTQVCITPQQLNTASTTMNWFSKFFGQSKCVDGKALDQAVTAARGDLLAAAADPGIASELKKAEPHLKAAEPYLKAASEKGKPHYQAAAKKAMPFLKKAFAGLGEKGTATQARLAPVQTAAAAAAPQQNINKWRGPLSVIIKPGSGFCPNGCKPPQYDNPTCVNEVYEGRGYRNCPWLGDGSIENSSCGTCGAILMPKNKYGYARTRPGLFDTVSLDSAVSRSTKSIDPKNIDHEKIGRTFMNELARTKDFSLPFISKREFESVGRIVAKYELEGGASRKKTLTDTINNVLNTSNLPSQLLSNRKRSLAGDDGDDGSRGGGSGAIGKRLSADDLYSQKESKLESQSDNRLGGGSTAYKANYKPVDPRKGPRPYDSVWDIFRQ